MNVGRIYLTIFVVVVLGAMTVGMPIAQGSELQERRLEFETERMDFEQDEDVNEEFDPRDPDPEHINFLQWQEDFNSRGQEVPKGTYVGQYFAPSTLRYDYKPRRRTRKQSDVIEVGNERDSYRQTVGEYGVSVISETVEFSADDIMNGASEFWVKMPVHAEQLTTITYSIEYEQRIYNHEWVRKLSSETDIHSGFYMFKGEHDDFRIDGNYTSGIFDLRGEGNQVSHANSIITEDNFYSNSVYQRVNAIVEPDIEYTLAFLAITEDEPRIKLDEVKSENARVTMKSMNMEGATFDLDTRRYVADFQNPMCNFSTEKSSQQDLPLSPHFSFTFTSGIGRGSLFGASLKRETNVHISDNIEFNEDEAQDNYLSHYIPFKYSHEDGSEIAPNIGVRLSDENQDTFDNVELPGRSYYDWSTKDILTYNGEEIDDYGFEFNRFFLFSTYLFNHTTKQDSHDAHVSYTFENLPENLTFLAKERDDDFTYNKRFIVGEPFESAREPIDGDVVGERTTYGKTATHWLGEKMRMGDGTGPSMGGRRSETIRENESNVERQEFHYWTDFEDDFPERFFYSVHTANEWTEGRWNTVRLPPRVEYIDAEEAVKRGIPEGTKIRTRHRDYIIEVEENVDDVEVDDDSGGFLPDNPWDNPVKTVRAIGGYIVDRVTGVIRRNLVHVREQLEKVWVSMTNFFGNMWDGITDIGEWIQRSVMSIVDFLTQLAGDIFDMGVMMATPFSYIAGITVMILATFSVVWATDSLFIKGDEK